jgi:glycosyltransferase involved in cell wall biosynthesis
VGRYTDFKQPELFLKLAEFFPYEKFSMICQILGHNNKYDMISEKSKKMKNVTFISHIPYNQIDTFYQNAKIFVNTSRAEGFPNTFIQACKAGVPILSLNVNPDGFLDKFDCGICSGGSFEQLVESLNFMLAEDRYIEMGKNGENYVRQNHDIAKIAEEYKKYFRKI